MSFPAGTPGQPGYNPFYHLANLLNRGARRAGEEQRQQEAIGQMADRHEQFQLGLQKNQHKHEAGMFTHMMGNTDFKRVDFGVGGENGVRFAGERSKPAESLSPVAQKGQLPVAGSKNRVTQPDSLWNKSTAVGGGELDGLGTEVGVKPAKKAAAKKAAPAKKTAGRTPAKKAAPAAPAKKAAAPAKKATPPQARKPRP